MAVYSYVRVSTARQSDDGESLDVQQRTIAGYAMMQAMAIDHVFVERAVSGSVPLSERPEGKALLARLMPGDTIITAKLDRMFRSALDALAVLKDLKAQDVALHMIDLGGDVTGNGISKLVFTILSAVAEAERDRIRERITTVKADQKGRGAFLGGSVPFGFKKVAIDPTADRIKYKLEPDEAQQAALVEIKCMRANGTPLRTIQKHLAERGYDLSVAGLHKMLPASGADATLM